MSKLGNKDENIRTSPTLVKKNGKIYEDNDSNRIVIEETMDQKYDQNLIREEAIEEPPKVSATRQFNT